MFEQTKLFDENKHISADVCAMIDTECEQSYAESVNGEINTEYIAEIGNKHEGYGLAAAAFANVNTFVKRVSDDQKKYLIALQDNAEDSTIENVANDLYTHSVELVIAAVRLAAFGKRLLDDLFPVVDYDYAYESAKAEADEAAREAEIMEALEEAIKDTERNENE